MESSLFYTARCLSSVTKEHALVVLEDLHSSSDSVHGLSLLLLSVRSVRVAPWIRLAVAHLSDPRVSPRVE